MHLVYMTNVAYIYSLGCYAKCCAIYMECRNNCWTFPLHPFLSICLFHWDIYAGDSSHHWHLCPSAQEWPQQSSHCWTDFCGTVFVQPPPVSPSPASIHHLQDHWCRVIVIVSQWCSVFSMLECKLLGQSITIQWVLCMATTCAFDHRTWFSHISVG